jgi:hypothetical protein
MNNSTCVILVPCYHSIEPECDAGLRQLEARGYPVRRVYGFAQIDIGRSQIASSVLSEGFEELMWIDSDVVFEPSSVDRLRSHNLPLVCGLYAKKGRREFACNFLPETNTVVFGPQGGLIELPYAGFGFTLTRREVYETMHEQLNLPLCNERFGKVLVPYFLPMVIPDGSGAWYLGEDYAFCRRAQECGYRVIADTTIRLWHVGAYAYSWEDAGSDKQRFVTYNYHIAKHPPGLDGNTPQR